MNCPDFIGQTLDGKYQMTRELGRGGMGTVYLATHLGTERPVAVKIIAPQYMQRSEFVERFRREARAAGRLRHPNVVDVTDFGFADSADGQVAYLVMEYLDGCTLGEILDEEKNLPVAWTLDILEQVCSAVHEAHEQGIIHRDLKPDNIWLEPNQRGGYTVKVLDFGIAKLEEHHVDKARDGTPEVFSAALSTIALDANTTFSGNDPDETRLEDMSDTRSSESATIAIGAGDGTLAIDTGSAEPGESTSESETAIFDDGDNTAEFRTAIISEQVSNGDDSANRRSGKTPSGRSLYESKNSADLTRVGAVLGTPLYMSPEQCRGEHLGPSSDIYSLGIIAYQMLSGAPPFQGDFKDVMESHKFVEPRPFAAKKVRRKMKQAIYQALSKAPEDRPQTAEAFASVLQSRADGIFGLLRRALVIYSEHLPKFLMLTAFFSLPIVVLTLIIVAVSFLKAGGVVTEQTGNIVVGFVGFLLAIANPFCTNLIIGTNSWIVTQYLAVPLRPVRLRPALREARRRWKRVAGSGLLAAILPFLVGVASAAVGFAALFSFMLMLYPVTRSFSAAAIGGGIGAVIAGAAGFLAGYIVWILVPPVVMLENVSIREALARSRKLTSRSFATAAGAVFILFLIPALVAGTISYVVKISGQAFDPTPEAKTEVSKEVETGAGPSAQTGNEPEKKDTSINYSFGKRGVSISTGGGEQDMASRVKTAVLESLIQILWLPMQIFVFSFSAIIVALLYLKTRLAGGESLTECVKLFDDVGGSGKKWQERVRHRLIQSGRMTSKP